MSAFNHLLISSIGEFRGRGVVVAVLLYWQSYVLQNLHNICEALQVVVFLVVLHAVAVM